MNKNFGNTEDTAVDGAWEGDYIFATQKSSSDQVALVWSSDREVITALPVPSSLVPGSFDMDVSRLPADKNLVAALKMRRENELNLGSFSGQSHFVTVATDFSERTRILALDGDVLALDDNELFDYLIEAEREMHLGTDSHPVFELSLESTACSVTRLPSGQIAMTEMARESVDLMRAKMRATFGDHIISLLNLQIETPIRAAARYFLTAMPEGAAVTRAGNETELTAFLLVRNEGFSYGLWSPMTGLFSEYAFVAPEEVNLGVKDLKEPDEPAKLDAYIRSAFDQLILQLSPEKLELLQLSTYARVVWASQDGLTDTVEAIAKEYAKDTGLDFVKISTSIDEAVAGGLLLGSFTFGDSTAVGADIMPPVNLARDLMVLADKEEIERRELEEVYMAKRRSQAVFTLLAAPVVVIACLFALVTSFLFERTLLTVRSVRADQKTQELKPALERRRSYEANLKWYQEFITQVSALRRQQPVGIGMLYQLNQSYPFDIDGSFYISDMKLKPDAGIELTGLARSKDAVTSFLRSLEFAGGKESGSRLFSNLTYEVQEGIAQTTIQVGGNSPLPTVTGSTLTGKGPAPGVIAWTIRGNYLPMAEFVPVDPAKAAEARKAGVKPPTTTGPPAAPGGAPAPPAAPAPAP
ncbi:MAG: hypothetical protein HKN25_15660 [Pyrinomonadaceae bacterium]|nr:hypothetical protein [Pyrinomonadaceae bacterium]